jgi:pimeloyl-ACP methyl ester carboxylesterase
VLAHGFSFAGGYYLQSLARLATLGFKVVAVDLAGHGSSAALLNEAYLLDSYRDFLSEVLDELGIERAVLVGHSLGGRLVAELTASEPERTIAAVLVDAAVGAAWDDLASFSRWAPPLLGLVGFTLAADTFGTLFLSGDQSSKMRALALPQTVANLAMPWRLVPPALSVLLAPASTRTLERLREQAVPTFVLHGDRDPLVPLSSARDAAGRSGAELVVIHGATHSWPLEDPIALCRIVGELLAGRLGAAVDDALWAAGVDPETADPARAEAAFCRDGALLAELGPEPGPEVVEYPASRYRWTHHPGPPRRGPKIPVGAKRAAGGGPLPPPGS